MSDISEDYLIFINELYPGIDKALNLLKLCNQDKIWITKNKEKLKVSEISISHAENLIRWLEKRVGWIKISALVEAEYDLIRHNGGEMAHNSLEEIVTELESRDGLEILNELPLYTKLRKIINDNRKKNKTTKRI